MPRKQNHKPNNRHQRQLDAIKLNAERMKLVRLIHCSSGRFDAGSTLCGLMRASGILTDKVRGDLEKM